jgi:hypothetical protein
MRLLASLVATALLAAACGGAPAAASPTVAATATPAPTPTPSPTPQLKYSFVADLKSSNEVPAITSAEASCTGKGTFALDTTKDTTGKITAALATFTLTVSACPTTTEITLFHIHKAAAGANGGVVVDSGQKAAEPIALTTGATSGTVTKSNITVTPENADAIIKDPAGFYFNVHSKLHGGGVVRGQLTAGS